MRATLKAGTWIALLSLTAAVLIAAVPTQTREIPVNSTTAVSLTSGDTQTGTVSAAGSTTTFDIDPNQGSSTADAYNGLVIETSACADGDMEGEFVITDYDGSDTVTFTPAATTGPDPNCTYTIGPSLPNNVREISIGGCAGTCYASTRSGGTAGTDRIKLTGGQWITLQRPRGLDYVEILSASATDTAHVWWD